jgi:hypothetical protein
MTAGSNIKTNGVETVCEPGVNAECEDVDWHKPAP